MSWVLHRVCYEQYEQQNGDTQICLFMNEAMKFNEMEWF